MTLVTHCNPDLPNAIGLLSHTVTFSSTFFGKCFHPAVSVITRGSALVILLFLFLSDFMSQVSIEAVNSLFPT
jgi:hypothetical protein